ncbi:MAG: PASTA domain-containing protein [Saprospiraceae bacterium]|nr:PASTA domain-containing protein [Saprospiraceae bacterium]
MNQTENKFKWLEILDFLKSRIFRYTLLRIAILFAILWILNSFFLNFYTNHGQKISLAKYEGLDIVKAKKHAAAKGFEIEVSDSIHLIGKPGGIIISQVPVAKSIVKRGSTIYVTTTRYQADIVMSSTLPDLYGKKLEYMLPELQNNFELVSKISGHEYDSGPEGHVMKVYYKNQLIVDAKNKKNDVSIARGDTLFFIVSNKNGGEVEVPDLRCKSLSEVKFLLTTSSLELGNVDELDEILDRESAFVAEQTPTFSTNTKIPMGSKISVKIQQTKPETCGN